MTATEYWKSGTEAVNLENIPSPFPKYFKVLPRTNPLTPLLFFRKNRWIVFRTFDNGFHKKVWIFGKFEKERWEFLDVRNLLIQSITDLQCAENPKELFQPNRLMNFYSRQNETFGNGVPSPHLSPGGAFWMLKHRKSQAWLHLQRRRIYRNRQVRLLYRRLQNQAPFVIPSLATAFLQSNSQVADGVLTAQS